MEYTLVKLLHIISSTLLFGTGLGTAYYMVSAYRTGDAQIIAPVANYVVRADWLFTTPAVIVQPLSGLWLLELRGESWLSSWVLTSLILYIAVGCCWIPVVWIQIRLRDMARRVATGGELPGKYHRLYRLWFILGWPAFILVIAIFYLMIRKPVLW